MKKRTIQPAPVLEDFSDKDGIFNAVLGKFGDLKFIQKANNEYLYWDKFKYLELPPGISSEDAWRILKLSRRSQLSALPFKDANGNNFGFWLPDSAQRSLHNIDKQAAGQISADSPVINSASRQRYLINSLMEEAIASSQIEGAATTRKVAKELLRTKREPSTKGEKMIVNNYLTIQQILGLRNEKLSPGIIFQLQRSMTEGLLDSEDIGRLRRKDEPVYIIDSSAGDIVHVPTPAKELPERLERLCEFANSEIHDKRFIHPVIKGIILHFWLAYDHPFVDGNGRTARALFYWYMLANGYWLFEFLPISRHLLRSRAQYEKAFLYAEQDDSDATYFIVYHLGAIERALIDLQEYLAKKQEEYKELSRLFKTEARLNLRQQAIIRHALENPGFTYTIESHQTSHGVSYPTARNDLLSLVRKRLLILKLIGKKQHFISPTDLEERLDKYRSV